MDESTRQPEASAQAKQGSLNEWMMVGVGLTALMSVLALIVSVVALGSNSGTDRATPAASASTTSASAPAAASAPTSIKLVVKSDGEHGKKGPGGVWHDAVLPALDSVKPGQTVNVTVYNYDGGPHTFTAPSLGVNAVIPAASGKAPNVSTFKFTAPSQPGTYQWWCSDPCDPWAMGQQGYMQGTVSVRA